MIIKLNQTLKILFIGKVRRKGLNTTSDDKGIKKGIHLSAFVETVRMLLRN